MSALTLFGLATALTMLVSYALERRSHWWVLAFFGACCLGATYGFLADAWPLGVLAAAWALITLAKWVKLTESWAGDSRQIEPKDLARR